ncbi:hypothetical protein Tco_0025846 [Tanacetum coccineum]
MSHHKKAFAPPSLTKNFFANMKRVGKGYSGVITPLFDTMMVPAADEEDIAPSPPSTSQPQPKQKTKKKTRRDAAGSSSFPHSVTTPSSSDPPPGGEDSMQLNELMVFCLSLQQQVLDLQKNKDAQGKEVAMLKKRVKKLEGKKGRRTSGLRRLRKVGLGATIVSSESEDLGAKDDASKQGRTEDEDFMFDMDADLQGDEVIVDEAQRIVEEIKSAAKHKEKGISIVEPSEATTTTTQTVQFLAKDKGKAILVEPERPMKRKDQILADEELAQRLFAEEKAQLEKEENDAKLIANWDNVQATIDADRRLAEQL